MNYCFYKSIKKRTNSIQNSIFIKFTVIYCIIILILYSILTLSTRYTFAAEAQTSSQREIAALASTMDTTINHLYDYAITTSLNSTLIKTTVEYPAPPASEARQYAMTQLLNGIINSIIGLNSSISHWGILSLGGEFFPVSDFNMSNIQGFNPDSIINIHHKRLAPCISGPYPVYENKISSSMDPCYVFVLSKPIVRLDLNQICGYVIFLIDSSTLSSIFEKYLPADTENHFYILDSDDRILLSSDLSLIGLPFTSEQADYLNNSQFSNLKGNGFYLSSPFNGDALLYSMRQLNGIDWKIITSYPLEALMTEQKVLSQIILTTACLALCAFLTAAFFIARSISHPLRILSGHMEKIAEDSYHTITVPQTMNEVETLYNGYNYMMNKTNELLNSIYEEHAEKTEYQFKLLQSQIKPHFLYNTLEMIKALIDLEMNETASKALTSLSMFYRLSLSHGADIIRIQDELEISENYLALEKMRHPEYFNYSIEYPDEICAYSIPKLTLQPILENSVLHGMTNYQSKGRIHIAVREEKEHLVFTVEDNGQGISEAKLHTLLLNIDQKQAVSSDSFGLSNINRRLKMFFGDLYSIKIESQLGMYTRITLSIPKIEPSVEKI